MQAVPMVRQQSARRAPPPSGTLAPDSPPFVARWRFPRAPQPAAAARRVLDLYAGNREGQPPARADRVIGADERTRGQALVRRHPTTPSRSGQAMRAEHEHERDGTPPPRGGGGVGRCDTPTGSGPFGAPVDQIVMRGPVAAPRASAGSSTTAAASGARRPWTGSSIADG